MEPDQEENTPGSASGIVDSVDQKENSEVVSTVVDSESVPFPTDVENMDQSENSTVVLSGTVTDTAASEGVPDSSINVDPEDVGYSSKSSPKKSKTKKYRKFTRGKVPSPPDMTGAAAASACVPDSSINVENEDVGYSSKSTPKNPKTEKFLKYTREKPKVRNIIGDPPTEELNCQINMTLEYHEMTRRICHDKCEYIYLQYTMAMLQNQHLGFMSGGFKHLGEPKT